MSSGASWVAICTNTAAAKPTSTTGANVAARIGPSACFLHSCRTLAASTAQLIHLGQKPYFKCYEIEREARLNFSAPRSARQMQCS